MPETVWTGWSSKRVAMDGLVDEAAVSTLSDLTLLSAPLGSLAPAAWERVAEPMAWASVDVVEPVTREPDSWSAGETPLPPTAPLAYDVLGQALHLALDDTTTGHVLAQSGRALDGDFEVIAFVETDPADRLEGATQSFELALTSLDGRDQAAIGFHETPARRIMRGSLMRDGAGVGYAEVPMEGVPPSWLRLRRDDGRLSATFWSDCVEQELALGEAVVDGPLYLRPVLGNEWEASVPASLEATFSLEQFADGPDVDWLEPWEPAPCSGTAVTAAPEP